MGKTIAYLISLVAITGLLMVPSSALAIDRLTDSEVDQLLDSLEKNRETFEAALDEKIKNSILVGPRGEVDANEYLDDLQDQVERTRTRFKADYSASSEVISLLDFATRLDRFVSTRPAGFKGSTEWGPFSADLQRLAAAYNTTIPTPAGGLARRYNDAELVAAAANVVKLCDPFRREVEASLTANKTLSPEVRQSTLQQVDMLKSNAQALNQSLGKNDQGVPQADALIKQALVVMDVISKNPLSAAATAAWTPLRKELGKVALSYEVNNRNLPVQ